MIRKPWLAVLLVLAAAFTWALASASRQPLMPTLKTMPAQVAKPRLRPYLFVNMEPPGAYRSGLALGGGWLATFAIPSGVAYTDTFETLELYDLDARHWLVVHPKLLRKGVWSSSGPSVSHDWVVWVQSVGSQMAADWQVCVYNIRSGRDWVVDSARAEGIDPRAFQGPPGAAEVSLSGKTLAWTTYRVKPNGSITSVLKLANLDSRRTQVVASLPVSRRLEATIGWPSTDGRYLAWDRSDQSGDSLYLYDLVNRRMVGLPRSGQASEPTVGFGYLAWKIGTRFGSSTGLEVLNLHTRQRFTVNTPNAARPSFGTCDVAYQVGSLGIDGLYDVCAHEGILLYNQQRTWPDGRYFAGILLDGSHAAMTEGMPYAQTPQPHFALFHLRPQHVLYDFYH